MYFRVVGIDERCIWKGFSKVLLTPVSIRENFEKRECTFLAPFACLSSQTRGRLRGEPPCPVRTAFQLDKFRIVYSNAFRRLKYKTQVFLSPLGDQYRTRLTHTLEVAQIATTIARAMRLNEDLVEAIALAHDLGHPPFGHGGEVILKEICSGGFSHHEQSLRVVDALENNGDGLNLTFEVRDGILKHSKGYGKIIPNNPEELPCTHEGRVVRIADIIAYLNHDLEDAIRSGVITRDQVPASCVTILGNNHIERATTMIMDVIKTSTPSTGEFLLNMSDEVFGAMSELRHFLYDNVYRAKPVHREFIKAKKILSELFSFFMTEDEFFEKELKRMGLRGITASAENRERSVCDFMASMTDRYALALYHKIFFPEPIV
ncbi:MAG: deoxyguanosinetriphosphate triphosphohydrolase [Deltaproteobacteria bacterium]|nr:deoxyguanosinetriphosphate triphosphohydrolase [Deltaproteobacteria bacterium]MBW2131180.1 deoxyguanosinetriphosphate triphosphohydrolase [Deltaproteobacteria bacterium]